MSRQKPEIEISADDVKYIYGTSLYDFKETLKNAFCMVCKAPQETEITKYKVLLDDLNNLELEGHCKECGSKVGSYIATGQVEQFSSRIEAVRITKKYEKK